MNKKYNYEQEYNDYLFLKQLLSTPGNFSDLNNVSRKKLNLLIIRFLVQNQRELLVENRYKFKTLNSLYNDIIDKFCSLVKKLNLNDSLDISNLYSYLLWNGCFSKNMSIKFSSKNNFNINEYSGFNIMQGNGVCLNFSTFLRDILNKCGYKSAVISNIYDSKLKTNYSVDEILLRKKKRILPRFKLTKLPNHAMTLIDDKGMYLYDPTNFLILSLKNKKLAEVIGGTGKFILSPYFSFCLNISNTNSMVLDKMNESKDFTTPYNINKFLTSLDKVIELCEKNNIILEFYKEISNDINKMNYNIKKLNLKRN